jgi:predicted urease superfamily metal-dependent hydrolase
MSEEGSERVGEKKLTVFAHHSKKKKKKKKDVHFFASVFGRGESNPGLARYIAAYRGNASW